MEIWTVVFLLAFKRKRKNKQKYTHYIVADLCLQICNRAERNARKYARWPMGKHSQLNVFSDSAECNLAFS